MKPFDLERALAGDPVVTRDGRPVTQLTCFDADSNYLVYGVLDGIIESWCLNGENNPKGKESRQYYSLVEPTAKGKVTFIIDQVKLSQLFMSKEQTRCSNSIKALLQSESSGRNR